MNKKFLFEKPQYSKVLTCIKKEFGLSIRDIADKVNELNCSKINGESEDEKSKKKLGSDFYQTCQNFINGRNDESVDKRVVKNFSKIASVLNVSPDIAYYRNYEKIIKLAKCFNIEENDNKFEWLNSIKIYDSNSEIEEYKQIEIEKNYNIDMILKELDKLSLLECYKLDLYFEDFKQINNDAFWFVYYYAWLNNEERKNIKIFLIEHESKLFKSEKLYIRSLSKSDNQLKKSYLNKYRNYSDEKIRTCLRNRIKELLKSLAPYEVEEWKNTDRIKEITGLDLTDWYLIQSFYNLEKNVQEQLLKKCEKLAKRNSENVQ